MQQAQITSTAAAAQPAIHRTTQAKPWLVTVKKLAGIYEDAEQTEPAIRANIFKAEDRQNSRGERIAGNGLSEHRAIIRRGRKVLIDVDSYGNWLAGRAPAEQTNGGAL